jgi:RNA polymerase sigma-70 factor (ECF subfamily)
MNTASDPSRPAEPAEEFIPTRGSLLNRLKDVEDDESWRKFFNTYWKLIYGVALKSGLTEAEAQDVVQETIIAVARNIPAFKYDPKVCSFKSWLLQVTRSRISNQFRKEKRHRAAQQPTPDATRGTALLERLPDPARSGLDALWDEEWKKNLMDTAIDRVKRRVDIEQFQIFDFYVLKKWPARKVAATLGVHIGQVYLARHRVTKLVKQEIKNLEARIV